ncbi:MAG: phosphatase PAP2 family protein [Acidimicrobiales bacterium]
MTTQTDEPPAAEPRPRHRLRWWREVLYCAAFYAVYTAIRDIRGDKPVSVAMARTNAKRIIGLERIFGLFQERRIQAWFLHSHLVIKLFDDYYGTAHFVITFLVLLYLFRRHKDRYPLWRNTLAITTALALIGFAFFPLMPPRLLPADAYHFVDTLKAIGGLWSFDSGPVSSVSNQYAAMPSLHFGWSLWCAASMGDALKGGARRWRWVVWLYPALTLVCIVATGNHYLADAVGGAITFGLGYLGARVIGSYLASRRASVMAAD